MKLTGLRRFIALGAIAAVAFTGCAREDEEVIVDESEPVVEEPAEVVEETPRHPLTGEAVAEGSVSMPAIMAKVDHENRPLCEPAPG